MFTIVDQPGFFNLYCHWSVSSICLPPAAVHRLQRVREEEEKSSAATIGKIPRHGGDKYHIILADSVICDITESRSEDTSDWSRGYGIVD
jgi:hypothetical protein